MDLNEFLDDVKVPTALDKVYKDECVYSFDRPVGTSLLLDWLIFRLIYVGFVCVQDLEDGLYVCLSTFHGVGKRFLPLHLERTGSRLYLHLKKIRIEKSKSDDGNDEVPAKITKLAIGMEGGFQQENNSEIIYEDIHNLVVYPNFVVVELNNPLIPEKVRFHKIFKS